MASNYAKNVRQMIREKKYNYTPSNFGSSSDSSDGEEQPVESRIKPYHETLNDRESIGEQLKILESDRSQQVPEKLNEP
jgi:hypothetical protein